MKGIIYLLTQIVIQSEAKNLEYIKWVFPRSFLPSVVWMTPCGNLYIVPYYNIPLSRGDCYIKTYSVKTISSIHADKQSTHPPSFRVATC